LALSVVFDFRLRILESADRPLCFGDASSEVIVLSLCQEVKISLVQALELGEE